MKKGLVITGILAAMLAGMLALSAYLTNVQNQKVQNALADAQRIELQLAELEAQEAELSRLLAEMEAEQNRRQEELTAAQQQLTALQSEKETLQTQLAELPGQLEAMRQQLLGGEGDESYYLEVYDALTEGYEKVKSYLAGN